MPGKRAGEPAQIAGHALARIVNNEKYRKRGLSYFFRYFNYLQVRGEA